MTTHTTITDYFAGATLDDGSLLCHSTTDATVKTASATSEMSAGSAVYSAVFVNIAAQDGSIADVSTSSLIDGAAEYNAMETAIYNAILVAINVKFRKYKS